MATVMLEMFRQFLFSIPDVHAFKVRVLTNDFKF